MRSLSARSGELRILNLEDMNAKHLEAELFVRSFLGLDNFQMMIGF